MCIFYSIYFIGLSTLNFLFQNQFGVIFQIKYAQFIFTQIVFKETTHHRLFKLKYPIISFIHKTVENTVCIKMGILHSNTSNRCFSFNMIYTFLGFSGGKKKLSFPFPIMPLTSCVQPDERTQSFTKGQMHSRKRRCCSDTDV